MLLMGPYFTIKYGGKGADGCSQNSCSGNSGRIDAAVLAPVSNYIYLKIHPKQKNEIRFHHS